jgi:hypothetical protein
MALVLAIKEAKDKETPLHILSLDIKKAFDSIEHWAIELALGEHGLNVPENIIHVIMDTMKNNTIQIKTDAGLTEPIPIGRGVRQGDPLSGLLFNIALDPLLGKIDEIAASENNPILGAHSFVDDQELVANSSQMLEEMWQTVKQFMDAMNIELNAKKSTYVTNDYVKENEAAELKYGDETIPKAKQNEPFRILGVHMTMNLDWTYQKKLSIGKMKGTLRALKKRKITDIQYVDVVNTMVIPAIAYSMNIVHYSDDELKNLNKELYTAIRQRLRIVDTAGWEDWLTLNRQNDGGLGLSNLKDVHDATRLNAFLLVANGPKSAAKTKLEQQEEQYNLARDTVDTEGIWKDLNEITKRRKIALNRSRNGTMKTQIMMTLWDDDKLDDLWECLFEEDILEEDWKYIDLMFDTLFQTKADGTPVMSKEAKLKRKTAKAILADTKEIRERKGIDDATVEGLLKSVTRTANTIVSKLQTPDRKLNESQQNFVRSKYLILIWDGKEWEPSFTDGSEKDGKAG